MGIIIFVLFFFYLIFFFFFLFLFLFNSIKMATAPDPFFVVKEDVEGATEGLLSLFDRYQTLMNQSDNSQDEELQWTVSELKTGIKSVEYDLDCLNETVEIVEEKRDKFKIDENELY